MQNKADFLKRLHESENFKRALGQTRTNAERKRVTAAAEEFVVAFADVLAPLLERAERDPEFRQHLAGSLVEQQELVTGSDPVVTGSVE